MADPALSYCGDQVRRYDRERFLTALFAPPALREDLFTLYAFNLELARVRETVREPIMGQIRFQWWRDALAEMSVGAPLRQHAIADALAGVVQRHDLPLAWFEQLIDGREQDLDTDPPADLATLINQCRMSAGMLTRLAARILGGSDQALDCAEQVGTAHGLMGTMRIARLRAQHGRVDVPADLLATAGLTARQVLDGPGIRKLPPIIRDIAAQAQDMLAQARRQRRQIAKTLYPAFLIATLTDHSQQRLAVQNFDPFHPQVLKASPWLVPRLTWAGWSGRW